MPLCHCVGALSINVQQHNGNTTKLIRKWLAFYPHTKYPSLSAHGYQLLPLATSC